MSQERRRLTDQPKYLFAIATAVISTVLGGSVLSVGGMLFSKLDGAATSITRIETVALFHKEKIDEVVVRLGRLEERVYKLEADASRH